MYQLDLRLLSNELEPPPTGASADCSKIGRRRTSRQSVQKHPRAYSSTTSYYTLLQAARNSCLQHSERSRRLPWSFRPAGVLPAQLEMGFPSTHGVNAVLHASRPLCSVWALLPSAAPARLHEAPGQRLVAVRHEAEGRGERELAPLLVAQRVRGEHQDLV